MDYEAGKQSNKLTIGRFSDRSSDVRALHLRIIIETLNRRSIA